MTTLKGDALLNSIKPTDLKPWCLEALERFPDASLSTREVLRLADHLYLQSPDHDPDRYMNSQSVRLAVSELVTDNHVFRRKAEQGLDGATLFYGSSHMEVWLSSLTRPVPVWTIRVTEALDEMKIPKARINPLSKNHMRRAAGLQLQPGDTPDAKVEIVVSLIRELAKDSHDGGRVRQLETKNARLEEQLAAMKAERDDAVKSLKSINRARQMINELLGTEGQIV